VVELLAATGGAILTAVFVSAGSLSYRGKRNREDVVSLLTKVELISEKIDEMHIDMRDIYGRLNSLDISVAEIKQKK
tara:strand:- start:1118 stop:1348 length:231 start_codon:yes stop_codon:yes gene_type:complete